MKTITSTPARVIVASLVAAAIAAAVGGVSLARAGGSGRVLTFTEVQTNATFVDISHNPQGAPGDQAVFRSAVKSARGRRIGSSSITCEIVFGGQLQCSGVYRLPGGTLTGVALVSESQASTTPVHIAITGGTGVYAGASGQGVSTPVSPTVSRSVIHLQ